MTRTLTHLVRAGAAVAALTVAGAANASFVNSTAPDPFFGGPGVVLEANSGSLIELPSIGPGGITLYTDQIIIDNFTFPSVASSVFSYTADFFAELLDNTGASTGATVDLTGGSFVVDYTSRSSPFQTGTFDMVLNDATFSGTTSVGDAIVVDLANIPTANVSILPLGGGAAGPWAINYNTPFVVDGQYELNDDGNLIQTPGLGDINGQPLAVPVPATALILLPGLLGVIGLRRRKVIAA
jgi:hypothetical protein